MILKIIYFFLFCICFDIHASNLTNQLNSFLKKEYHLNENDIKIIVHSPLKKNFFCEKPIFSLVSNVQSSRLVNVLLTCNKKHFYLEVEVQMQGEYIVAKRKINRGKIIQESDLKILVGRLDILPSNTYRKKKDVINKVNLRDIFPLEPITSSMMRPYWLIKINQQVTVIIKSKNFIISCLGKALSNGVQNQSIRVKLNTGKIIYGTISDNGEVIISL